MKTARQINLWLLTSNRWFDEIMHACDLFERFKAYTDFHPRILEITLKPGVEINQKWLDQIVSVINTYPEERIICASVENTDLVWRDESVKMISNGDQFCLLQDYLEGMAILNKPKG